MSKRAATVCLVATILVGGVAFMVAWAEEPAPGQATGVAAEPMAASSSPPAVAPAEKQPAKATEKWAPAVEPKPLSDQVRKGVGWLVEQQLESGAWGQGEESRQMGGGGELKDKPSVADTCMATLALIRSGSTPSKGEHAANVRKAVEYLCGQIEESDTDSLYITPTRGTRVQSKLGPYIDTFMAAMVLPEVKDKMPSEKANQRVAAALDKVLAKMQKNQRKDGTWGGRGWATTLQQGVAVKAMNRAAQVGAPVDEQSRERAESQARGNFDRSSGKFSDSGSAGVELYSAGANLGAVAESAKTNKQREQELEEQIKSPTASPEAKAKARETLKRYTAVKADLAAAQDAVIARLDDKRFVAGFGSNGGEEFLSYMNIGESLVVKGGEAWKSWDKSITENLNRIQNNDGSWTGHHCITGRTFCTASALLVLMVDRSPVPITDQIKRR